MEYSEIEKQTLELLHRTDFKNLSKTDVISIASKLSELPPDVAANVLAQFPELVKLIQSQMNTYKDILGGIIESDDESLKQVFSIAERDQGASTKSREQLYDFAKTIHEDISKCLDKDNLTQEQIDSLLDRDMELFKTVSEKDTEIRTHEKDIVDMVQKKDSEKRELTWSLVKIASGVLVFGGVIAASALGVKIKLPKKIL